MRLDGIQRIERYITDTLLSSPQIPLGVNVIRLASKEDEEGIARMTRSIVVRYVGSQASVIREVPLVLRRTLRFELTHSAQSYLTQSGHDYALQMCAGAMNALGSITPSNSGSNIVAPLHLLCEQFDGLTDSSHYVYTQSWECSVEEIYPAPPIDPCVLRGNCSYLFPACTVQEVVPGDVLFGNVLYSPVLPPPNGFEYDSTYCGVILEGENLVYKADPSQTFLENWTEYTLVSTNTFDESGELLKVNVYDSEGELFFWYFASNCDCRKVIKVAGTQPATNSNWIGGQYVSSIDQLGNTQASSAPEAIKPLYLSKNGFGYVQAHRAYVYSDPRLSEPDRATVRYGTVYRTVEGKILTHNNVDYYLIGGTPIGLAWIRTIDFDLIQQNPTVICEGAGIDDIDDGTGGTPGKIPSC